MSSLNGGRTGGPISFFTGVMALLVSAGMGLAKDHKHHVENEAYRQGGYNMGLQIDKYDDRKVLMDEFYLKRVKRNIQFEYPKMSEVNLEKVMWMAVAKVKIEEETPFHYYVPDRFQNALGDISRFVTENCRRK